MPILLSFPRPLSLTGFSPATSTSSFRMNLFHQHSNIFFFYKKKKVFLDPLFLSSYHSLLYSCSWSTFSKGLSVILHFLCNHWFYKVTPKGVRNNTVDTIELPTNHRRKYSIANIVEDSCAPFPHTSWAPFPSRGSHHSDFGAYHCHKFLYTFTIYICMYP